eukprot:COSAG01_NODE_2822_length_7009_cov_3.862663_3_plen_176_part_00
MGAVIERSGGVTVEVVLQLPSTGAGGEAASAAHSTALHENPLISSHGVGSGWELRLGPTGEVCFLATFDGAHIELTGRQEGAAAAEEKEEEPSRRCVFRRVAAVLTGAEMLVYSDGQLVASKTLHLAGKRFTPFDGPIEIGRNPQWTERHCPCVVVGVRLSAAPLQPDQLLTEPC